MDFYVKLGGITIAIHSLYKMVYDFCGPYCVSHESIDPQKSLDISMTHDEIDKRIKAYKSTDDREIEGRYTFPNPARVECLYILKKIADQLPNFDAFLLHGSIIAMRNHGYLFAAPSGVGKTTRTKIWLNEFPEAFVVNGDKPIIRVIGSGVIACGTPWCGKEGWNTNTTVPLRAIFLLERVDEGEQSTIREISLGKAFPFLLQQTHRPSAPDLMRKTIELIKAMEDSVKFYKFRSTPTPEAIHLAYEIARYR